MFILFEVPLIYRYFFFFHFSRMTGLPKVGSTSSETISCRKSRDCFNKELTIVNESLETGEPNVTYISFNHDSFFHWDFNSCDIFTFKILKEKQVSGEPGVREEEIEWAKC